MASLLFSPSRLPTSLFSTLALFIYSPNPHRHHSQSLSSIKTPTKDRALIVSSALAESNSSKSLDDGGRGEDGSDDDDLLPLLRELSDCLLLPPDYLSSLPRDLRLDLNDAAFDLSNGPVLDDCGEVVGDLLLNLSRAWEQADTSTSNSLARQLPSMESFLTKNVKASLGKRLVSAGRRFQAMGQYADGEPQKIATTMIKIGKQLSRGPVVTGDEEPKMETRTLKFGELQVELTSKKAFIGAGIGLVFGILSWQISRGIENIPESSLEYANDNALLLAKSLRGALLALFYSSAALSVFTSIGLVLLGRQLSSESK
ncbi:unnamed protein product [Musa acuminata subsp. malaccensis]|uniref:(wild Malaysian banana) hypothetical protein n=1 Tax=Musa acuminata subsp. malaccensis TaxID=214687 RepID=A0A804J5H4_MUSAM|nr:PREDICTED: uncharacterized protein LOC103985277 [Musa acuminata subsp. malaccensis]CAG1838753.1 unnamed protein product [Musa acuminata subsp. malaccensis]